MNKMENNNKQPLMAEEILESILEKNMSEYFDTMAWHKIEIRKIAYEFADAVFLKLQKENKELTEVMEFQAMQIDLYKKENKVLEEINDKLNYIAEENGIALIDLTAELTSVKDHNQKLVEALDIITTDDPNILEIPAVKEVLTNYQQTNKCKCVDNLNYNRLLCPLCDKSTN